MDSKTLTRLLAATDLPRPCINAAVRHISRADGISAAFWEALRTDPELSPRDVDELRFVVGLGELTEAHLPLVRALLERRKAGEINHTADLFAIDWPALVAQRTNGRAIGAPAKAPGKNAAQRAELYCRRLTARLPVLYATGAVVHALRHDLERQQPELVCFFTANPDFDLRGAGIDPYVREHPEALQAIDTDHRADVLARLYALQRLFWLTDQLPDQAATITRLAAAGLDSAQAIAALGENTFCKHLPAYAHPARIHARAAQHTATVLALNARDNRQYDAIGVAAIGGRMPAARDAASQTILRLSGVEPAVGRAGNGAATVPDWQQLFGAPESGACEHGRSVLSPSAYLVDLLSMLEHLTLVPVCDARHESAKALDVLRERRPDIEDLELSGANAETALPYIDLVLEVLETALFPMHFALVDQDQVRRTIEDLKQLQINAALRSAFNANERPLGVDARVDADPDAQDTRWRITDTRCSYVLENVVDHGDQIRVAVKPARRCTSASTDELRAAPQYVDTNAYQALRTRAFPWVLPFDLWTEEARAWLARLDTPRQRLIELFDTARDTAQRDALIAAEFFALAPGERALLATKSNVPWTLWGYAREHDAAGAHWSTQLSGVPEFLARCGLAPDQLNALLEAHYIRQHQPVRLVPATPDAAAMIHGVNDEVFERMHRFLRLQRKTGWSIGEFDDVLDALGNPKTFDDAVLIRAHHIRQLQDEFKLPLGEVLGWLGDIDTTPGNAGAKSMARAFGVTPIDFLKLRELTGPHHRAARDLAASKELMSFVAAVRRLQDSGLHIADLDYLLHPRNAAKSTFATSDEQLRRTVAAIGASLRGIADDNRIPDSADDQQLIALLRVKLHQINVDDAQISALLAALGASATPCAALATALHGLERKGLGQTMEASRLADLAAQLGALPDAPSRMRLMLEWLLPCVRRLDSEIAVTRHLAEAFGMEMELATRLVGAHDRTPGVASRRMLDSLLDPFFVGGNAAAQDAAITQAAEFIRRLHALAFLIVHFDMQATEVGWLVDDEGYAGLVGDGGASVTGAGGSAAAFARLVALVELMAVRDRIGTDAVELMRRIGHAPDTERQALCDTLSGAVGCRRQDIDALMSVLPPPGTWTSASLSHFAACLATLKALGATVDQARRWAQPELAADDAMAIRQAAKDRVGQARWQEIAVPLRDALRERQRSTLVACLLAQHRMTDTHELYQHFLLDVEMGPGTLTSRTRLAISSLQLYVQRLLMNLEDWRISEDDAAHCRQQWQSLKNYRVWEANRKVFLYPENWIEPDLRKDKTGLFRALENEVLQGDLTTASAERALRSYLEGLEEIGKLEICACTADPEPDVAILHVFARTRGVPRSYYYRRREKGVWSAWEKLEFGVDSDHLIPLVFNHRLYLFWPEFTEQTLSELKDDKGHKLTIGDNTLQSWEYWEVRLAFSQCRQSGWSPKNVLDERLSIDRPPAAIDATKKPPPLDKEERRSRTDRRDFSFVAEVVDTAILIRCARHENGTSPHVYTDQGGWRYGADAHVEAIAAAGATLTHATPFDSAWHRVASALVPDDTEVSLSVAGQTLFARLPRTCLPAAGEGAPVSVTRGVRLIMPQQGQRIKDGEVLKDRLIFVYQDHDRCLLIGARHPAHGTLPDAQEPAFTVENLYHPAASDFIRRLNRDGMHALLQRVEQQKNREPVLFRLLAEERAFFANRDTGTIDRLFLHEHAAALVDRGLAEPAKAGAITIVEEERAGTHWIVRCGVTFACRVSVDRGGELLVDQDAAQQYGEPDATVLRLPAGEVDFSANGAYAQYNWELFLHVPLLLADRLGRNQRFEEAQGWFHHIFDPTDASGEAAPRRYWKVRPFTDDEQCAPILPLLTTDYAPPANSEGAKQASRQLARFAAQVERWRAAPFDPHAIAQLRVSAYQKTVVMKYIDNLIAWGDQLFRTDTIESINEATQLYVLAAEILGRRPQQAVVATGEATAAQNYRDIRSGENGFRDLWVELENRLTHSWKDSTPAAAAGGAGLPAASLRNYFCVPGNDKLLAYWDLVGDRLFKIRHGQNIEGTQRALALYEPPIDPGLLVRAAAAGVDLASALRDISAPLPHYRFPVMLAKAIEFCSDVRALAADFLAAIERRDAEGLEQLRLRQVSFDLQRQIGQKAIEEARQQLADLEQARQTKEDEKNSISDKIDWIKLAKAGGGAALPLGKAVWAGGLKERWEKSGKAKTIPDKTDGAKASPDENSAKASPDEKKQEFAEKIYPQSYAASSGLIDVSSAAGASQSSKKAALLVSQTTYMSAAATGTLPTMITGAAGVASPVALVMTGGQQMAESSKTWAKVAEVGGLIWEAAMEAKKVYDEYCRQIKDAEDHKLRVDGEIKGLVKRIAAANVHVELAELRKKQIDKAAENAEQIEAYMRTRFTSIELYGWRVSQLSALYFQTYQLAYDLAKRAERAFRYELGSFAESDNPYIRFGYWDSMKKGLLAGEQLHFDLRRMDKAYLDQNGRGYEITRHVSLRALDEFAGDAFARQVQSGELCFSLPETLFDRDYPGHYMRRIRAVRLSVDFTGQARPANVACTLTLLANSVRMHASGGGYARAPDTEETRFRDEVGAVQAIVTSGGVDDAGLFVVDFEDDRYLPFEGAGAISSWKIELPVDTHPELKELSDIVLHLSYTARDGGSALKKAAAAAAKTPCSPLTARRTT